MNIEERKEDFKMLVFENKNATNTEKEMYRYGGFYKIEDDDNHTRYVPVHTDMVDDNFPDKVEVEKNCVEYDTEIIFYHMAETVKCAGMFDGWMIGLIQSRMAELFK